LLHIWSQFYLLHDLLLFMKMHCFLLLLPLNSNCWWLGSTSQMISSSWMTPILTPTYSQKLVAWWLAS
jgi:hypothetical protein